MIYRIYQACIVIIGCCNLFRLSKVISKDNNTYKRQQNTAYALGLEWGRDALAKHGQYDQSYLSFQLLPTRPRLSASSWKELLWNRRRFAANIFYDKKLYLKVAVKKLSNATDPFNQWNKLMARHTLLAGMLKKQRGKLPTWLVFLFLMILNMGEQEHGRILGKGIPPLSNIILCLPCARLGACKIV